MDPHASRLTRSLPPSRAARLHTWSYITRTWACAANARGARGCPFVPLLPTSRSSWRPAAQACRGNPSKSCVWPTLSWRAQRELLPGARRERFLALAEMTDFLWGPSAPECRDDPLRSPWAGARPGGGARPAPTRTPMQENYGHPPTKYRLTKPASYGILSPRGGWGLSLSEGVDES